MPSSSFSKGCCPFLLKTGGGGVFLVTAVYVLLAAGLWHAERWALLAGMVLTAPQLVLASTWTVTWSCFVGVTVGSGFQVEPDSFALHLFGFGQHGVQLVVSHSGFNRAIASTLTTGRLLPGFGFNLVAVYVLVLLAVCCWWGRRTTNPAPGR